MGTRLFNWPVPVPMPDVIYYETKTVDENNTLDNSSSDSNRSITDSIASIFTDQSATLVAYLSGAAVIIFLTFE